MYSTFIGDNTTEGSLAGALASSNVFIEVAVNGVALSPRERLASVPYALNVNAAGIAGTIADANLSANIARLDGTNQTFTGRVNFSSVSNTFTGSFSGNGALVTNVSLASIIADQPPVIAWGRNDYGQTTVPASATGVVAIAAGGQHSLALQGDGTVIAWGYNTEDQTNVPASATGVVAIAGGGYHSLALRGDGTVIAWGYNSNGQTNVPASATGVVAIAAGGFHSLALRSDGTVIAWGANNSGQRNVPASATGVVAIAGGAYHSLALRGDGTVIAWGDNSIDQRNVPASATGVVAIAGGNFHSLALRSDGTVIAWGAGTNDLNDGISEGQSIVPASATGVVAIAGGSFHNLALRGDGTVIAWGYNVYGQTTLPVGATGVVAIAGGTYHSLALRSARALASTVLARLDAATNTFAGALSARSFVGNGSRLTGITNFVKKAGDTMTGALNLSAGGLAVGASQLVVTVDGNVGVGTVAPAARLDVGGSFRINGGTTFSKVQDGVFTAGPTISLMAGTGFLVATNSFPVAFSNIPTLTVSAVNEAESDETFSVTVRRVTTTNFSVNILRLDSPSVWTQNLRVSWHAWE